MHSVLRMHVEPQLENPALVLAFGGWNDAGEAATTALRFLNEAIASVPLADIDPEDFYDFTVRRPRLVQDPGGGRHLEWPSNRFRYGSIDASRELVVGIGVEPHTRWRGYCDAVAELAARARVSRVVLIGAYLADVVYSQPVALTGFASHASELEALQVVASGYEGPTGIVSAVAERLQKEGLPFVSLWAGLPHYIDAAPNPRGALALLQKLTEYLDFRIDDESLRVEAAEFEQKISKVVAADSELADYVRRLKKREFAQ